jgi:general secretion pathway protein N
MNVRTVRLATHVFAGTCGALLLFAIVQYAGFGRGYGWSADVADAADRTRLGDIDKRPVQIPPASAFAAIQAHPLFNEDRQPTPVGPSTGEDDVPPPSPLNVALTGVILDERNKVSIAMLQDKTRNQAIALKVGMPLEGEQASWTLVEVKPRLVVFRNAANETTEVELETATAPAPASARPRSGRVTSPANRTNNGRGETAANKKDASADLATRIEERRRKMREDAERLRDAKPAPPKK